MIVGNIYNGITKATRFFSTRTCGVRVGRRRCWNTAGSCAASRRMEHREFVLEAIRLRGTALEHAPLFQADREVVLAAVEQDGFALRYAAAELLSDAEIVLAAVRRDGWALSVAAPELLANRDIVLAAVQQDGWALRYVPAEIATDRDIVLAAVKQNGNALKYAEWAQDDREIALAAVQQDGDAIKYVALSIRFEPEIVQAHLRQKDEKLMQRALDLLKDEKQPHAKSRQCLSTEYVDWDEANWCSRFATAAASDDHDATPAVDIVHAPAGAPDSVQSDT